MQCNCVVVVVVAATQGDNDVALAAAAAKDVTHRWLWARGEPPSDRLPLTKSWRGPKDLVQAAAAAAAAHLSAHQLAGVS